MGWCGRAQSIHWHRFFVWVPRCRLFCPLLGGVDVSDMVFLGGNRVKLYAGPVSRLAWCVLHAPLWRCDSLESLGVGLEGRRRFMLPG